MSDPSLTRPLANREIRRSRPAGGKEQAVKIAMQGGRLSRAATHVTGGPRRRILLLVLPIALAGVGLPAMQGASASHIPLGDSHFEIDTDANLKVDQHVPAVETIDWGTPDNGCAPGEDKNCEIRKNEQSTGGGDDSFGLTITELLSRSALPDGRTVSS